MNKNDGIAEVESLDHEGRGVAHVDGKTIFINGALPYERVSYSSFRRKPRFENADALQVLRGSFVRTTPGCPHFGICGGCSMQHVEVGAQVAMKQRVLEDNLKHIGGIKPDIILAPIAGIAWHYRHRARLSARFVAKKGGVLVGFHERHSSFVADMHCCQVLPQHVSALIMPLRQLVEELSIKQRMPQIEMAVGADVTALVFRNMEPITLEDEKRFQDFVHHYTTNDYLFQIWMQPKGPESCYPLYPLDVPALSYHLPDFGIEMPYYPTEFTQVNPAVNQVMVKRALSLLDPQPGERIADLFCGIGNFTLPIARSGACVTGVEGSAALVKRAQENAQYNGLADRVNYHESNLFEVTAESLTQMGRFDKMLIDPPRDGAIELVKALDTACIPRRIIYVSCNPATLARDAQVLVQLKGYTLKAAGVMNMFPHTAHVESIAWFERE